MKNILAGMLVLAFSANVAGLSHHRLSRTHAIPAAAMSQRDLNATLSSLERAASATHSDIAQMRIDKWGASWKPGFLGKGSHVRESEATAASLQRNIVGALPGLISEVRSTHGSMTATFKLYDDLSVLCETLDSLLSAAESYGKRQEYGSLARDSSALSQVRRRLSSYIQWKAAAMEGRSNATYASRSSRHRSGHRTRSRRRRAGHEQDSAEHSSNTRLPKKIVVDDNLR